VGRGGEDGGRGGVSGGSVSKEAVVRRAGDYRGLVLGWEREENRG